MLTISYFDMALMLFSIFALTYAIFDGLDLLNYHAVKYAKKDVSKAKNDVSNQKKIVRGRNITYIMNKH